MKKNMWVTIIFLLVVLSTGLCLAVSNGYDNKIAVENIVFEWKLSGETIHIRLAAKTEGWVGIGFNPSTRMKDANFIIGYVKKGKVKITDHYGTTERQHEKDTKLGGQKNVEDIAGKEENGVTEITFSIPLDSEDPKDRPIWTNQDNIVLLAYGAGRDSFRAKHHFKTALKVNLTTGEFSTM
ncbi:MAG: DOMON domain-containing protein [Desulfobacterales bacterium]